MSCNRCGNEFLSGCECLCESFFVEAGDRSKVFWELTIHQAVRNFMYIFSKDFSHNDTQVECNGRKFNCRWNEQGYVEVNEVM